MVTILLFIKAPRRKHVKTRLSHTVGPERALATYRALVERQWQALPKDVRIEVHYTPHDADFELRKWLGDNHRQFPQSDGEMGARLTHSVEGAFDRGAELVICIGGDCPGLNPPHFEETVEKLRNGDDLVFGPSEDGGYYLIGLKSPEKELFQDIPWSSRNTLESSLNKAEKLGLKVGLLETLYDVDHERDLNRAIEEGIIQI